MHLFHPPLILRLICQSKVLHLNLLIKTSEVSSCYKLHLARSVNLLVSLYVKGWYFNILSKADE